MKIAFFSTQPYDKDYFERYNTQHEILFFEARLNEQTTNLAGGCNAVCAFVNDQLNAAVLNTL
ncbi:MAG TPA: 2-hydroxyacid dehydrogenase, partial [Chitinophagaceae bacterium]|nr:2-hydroxyacid dehydrogenase [Chitinophagaceae bacterium]